MKNYGQYNNEYKSSECFWGEEPAKYVKKVLEYIKTGNALDLGAGDGKNSFFLAKNGFKVTAVEISPYAVKNFVNRLIKEEENNAGSCVENIDVILSDVTKFIPAIDYDLVVSYGLLHCLNSEKTISEMIQKMKNCTHKGGLNVICTFTDSLPVPEVQKYLEPTLLPGKNFLEYYKDWETISFEEDIIEHEHPTHKVMHKHSVCRLIAKK